MKKLCNTSYNLMYLAFFNLFMMNEKNSKSTKWFSLRFVLLLCLTLGLAPFVPEPHIWGKIKWLWGGGVGMQAMDYFDVLLHGSPWLLLVYALTITLSARNKKSRS